MAHSPVVVRTGQFVRRFSGAAYEHVNTLRHRRELRALQRFHASSPVAQREAYAAALSTLMRRLAMRSDGLDEWREVARIDDPDELLAVWSELPLLEREEMRERFDGARLASEGRRGRTTSSSGTTGEPVRVLHDPPMLRAADAKVAFARQRLGWRPGMPIVALWGSPRDLGFSSSLLRRAVQFASNLTLLASYRVDDDLVDRFVAIVRRSAPVAVYGYTSLLAEVADRVLKRGIAVSAGAVAVAWNGAEALLPEHRDVFARAFGTTIRDWYGTRELNAVAVEIDAERPLTVLGPFDYVEVVGDHGRPAPPGEEGHIVVTSTACTGTPLVRYRVGDLAVPASLVPDTSAARALTRVAGRADQRLVLDDGTVVNALFWSALFRGFEVVRSFQVVLEPRDITRVLVVAEGADERTRAEVEREVRQRVAGLRGKGELLLEWVDTIPRTAQGKRLPLIDRRTS